MSVETDEPTQERRATIGLNLSHGGRTHPGMAPPKLLGGGHVEREVPERRAVVDPASTAEQLDAVDVSGEWQGPPRLLLGEGNAVAATGALAALCCQDASVAAIQVEQLASEDGLGAGQCR